MPSLNIPHSFSNGNVANATEVNANFASIKSFVESQTVQVDGSVKAGTNSLSTALMNIICPVGSISPFAGAVAPPGWLLCNGASTAGYPALIAIVGAATPNLAGRTLIGAGSAAGLTTRLLNATGGAETHVLTEAELANHNHGQTAHGHAGASAPSSGAIGEIGLQATGTGPFSLFEVATVQRDGKSGQISFAPQPNVANIQSTGSSSPHNNMQPFYVVNYIIKHD